MLHHLLHYRIIILLHYHFITLFIHYEETSFIRYDGLVLLRLQRQQDGDRYGNQSVGHGALNEMVEVSMETVTDRLGLADTAQIVVLNADGQQVPYQITYDGKVIFPAAIAAGERRLRTPYKPVRLRLLM